MRTFAALALSTLTGCVTVAPGPDGALALRLAPRPEPVSHVESAPPPPNLEKPRDTAQSVASFGVGDALVVASGRYQLYGQQPGGLVCPTGDDLELAVELMGDSRKVEVVTGAFPQVRAQWEAQHGAFRPFDPASVGCQVLPPGTRVQLDGQAGPLYHLSGDWGQGWADMMSVVAKKVGVP